MQLANGSLRLALVLALAFTSILLKMAPIITKEDIEEIVDARGDITMAVLKAAASGAPPHLQSAVTGALFIASKVLVSSIYPKHQSTFLLTVHLRASGRARKSWISSAAMSRTLLPKLHCDGRR